MSRQKDPSDHCTEGFKMLKFFMRLCTQDIPAFGLATIGFSSRVCGKDQSAMTLKAIR